MVPLPLDTQVSMIRENPLISVIVPVYNVGSYLRKCLDSICNQSYSNLEIIVVVSTSTDDSEDIADEYQKKDTRIIMHHRPPRGLSDARNVGVDYSSGQYIVFIDSDDFVAPYFIERLYTILTKYDCDIAQVGYLRIPETQNMAPIQTDFDLDKVNTYSNVDICLAMNSRGPYETVSWNKIYKRELFNDIRFPLGKLHEDVATTYKLYYSASRIGVSCEPLYFYRQVPTSIIGSPYSLKRLDAVEHTRERVRYFEMRNEYAIYGEALYAHIVTLYTNMMLVKENIRDSQEIQRNILDEMKEIYAELKRHTQIRFEKKMIASFLIQIPYAMQYLILVRRKIWNYSMH